MSTLNIPQTGNPPAFICPYCQRHIYGKRGALGMEILNSCAHPFEIHESGGKLTAVFKPNKEKHHETI